MRFAEACLNVCMVVFFQVDAMHVAIAAQVRQGHSKDENEQATEETINR